MRTLTLCCLPMMLWVLLAGCQPKYTQRVVPPRPLTAEEKDFEAVWEATRQALREFHFELDRQDRRDGVITTMPMTGMHFFEFWRKDAPRPLDYGESSLQTIYRTAKVTIAPAGEGAKTYQAQVEVFLRRSDKPRELTSSTSEAFGLFGSGGKRAERQAMREAQWDWIGSKDYVDLGNDRSLEAKLAAAIDKAAARLRSGLPAPR